MENDSNFENGKQDRTGRSSPYIYTKSSTGTRRPQQVPLPRTLSYRCAFGQQKGQGQRRSIDLIHCRNLVFCVLRCSVPILGGRLSDNGVDEPRVEEANRTPFSEPLVGPSAQQRATLVRPDSLRSTSLLCFASFQSRNGRAHPPFLKSLFLVIPPSSRAHARPRGRSATANRLSHVSR